MRRCRFVRPSLVNRRRGRTTARSVGVMLALAIVSQGAPAAAATEGNSVANWECAAPLIARSAGRTVSAVQVADRISDQCATPFDEASGVAATSDPAARLRSVTMYELDRKVFTMAISDAIVRARQDR